MRLNLNHLRYFWAVAHEGNLTRVAKTLNVSQSAISIQIGKLEHQVGHKLFERQGKRLVLTEAGRIALDYADTIFAAGAELLATLGEREGRARNVFRVGAIATLSRNFQIGFLRPLLSRADVEVVVRSGPFADLIAGLMAHRFDVVLSNHAPQRDAATSWVAHQIDSQPVSLIGAPDLIQSDGPAGGDRSLAHLLATHPIIVPTVETSIRAGFDALAERLGVRPQIAAEIDDMAMLRLMAREGVGLAVIPPIVVKDELDAATLAELAQLPGLVEAFYAITLRRRFPNPLLKAVLR